MNRVHVIFKDNTEIWFTEVTEVMPPDENNPTDLFIHEWWSGDEGMIKHFITFSDIESYSVYDMDDTDGEAQFIEFINNQG